MIIYINNETGEALTYEQMMKQFADEYDGDDETNGIDISEYYTQKNCKTL